MAHPGKPSTAPLIFEVEGITRRQPSSSQPAPSAPQVECLGLQGRITTQGDRAIPPPFGDHSIPGGSGGDCLSQCPDLALPWRWLPPTLDRGNRPHPRRTPPTQGERPAGPLSTVLSPRWGAEVEEGQRR